MANAQDMVHASSDGGWRNWSKKQWAFGGIVASLYLILSIFAVAFAARIAQVYLFGDPSGWTYFGTE